ADRIRGRDPRKGKHDLGLPEETVPDEVPTEAVAIRTDSRKELGAPRELSRPDADAEQRHVRDRTALRAALNASLRARGGVPERGIPRQLPVDRARAGA